MDRFRLFAVERLDSGSGGPSFAGSSTFFLDDQALLVVDFFAADLQELDAFFELLVWTMVNNWNVSVKVECIEQTIV